VEVAIVPPCLDSLLIGLYVLADEFFIDWRGPGRPRKITDAELVGLAVAQVLLDCPGDRKFLAWARWRLGHLFFVSAQAAGLQQAHPCARAAGRQVAELVDLRVHLDPR
jgi:hypothetical protein